MLPAPGAEIQGPVIDGEAHFAATPMGGGTWSFDVTVRHGDTGWTHYADRWDVLSESGEVLATRVLRHPHVQQQPFTRSLPDVALPEKVERVRIRAHDSVHDTGGAEVVVEISRGK